MQRLRWQRTPTELDLSRTIERSKHVTAGMEDGAGGGWRGGQCVDEKWNEGPICNLNPQRGKKNRRERDTAKETSRTERQHGEGNGLVDWCERATIEREEMQQ